MATPSAFPKDWKLIFSDEFDKDGKPNPAKWGYEMGLLRNKESQYYTDRRENARVEGGNLVIEARRESYKGSAYTAASLQTLGKFGFQYGRVEVRAKLPKGRGTWPAIWMMGVDINIVNWPRCGEIDIMEHVGHEPGVIHATVHGANASGQHYGIGEAVTIPSVSDTFHIYATEWHPDRLDFFVDGRKFSTYPYKADKWAYDRQFYLLLNFAVGGEWGGQKGIDDTIFPQKYLIDHVRVYQPPQYRTP